MESSVDKRGKVHFRRRQYGERIGNSTPDIVPMDDLRTPDMERSRFVERFNAREIKLDEGGRDSYTSGLSESGVKDAELPEGA